MSFAFAENHTKTVWLVESCIVQAKNYKKNVGSSHRTRLVDSGLLFLVGEPTGVYF